MANSDPPRRQPRPMLRTMIRNARLASSRDPGLHDIELDGAGIAAVRPAGQTPPAPVGDIDAAGRVVLPGFVGCHTHACFAGPRLDEWERKPAGARYLDIMQAGRGILDTLRATRQGSESELAAALLARLERMLAHGATTIEVKSAYGLETESELKMLRAIPAPAESFVGTVVPNACIGRAIDPDVEHDRSVEPTINETLPAVPAELPGGAQDAYCERGAWSLDDFLALADRARIEPGQRADLIILDHNDPREPAFKFGGNPVARVMVAGHWVRSDIYATLG